MKTLYKINSIIIIINVILGFTIVLGLLFMQVTGLCQVITYFIYLGQWNKISNELKTPFKLYGLLTTITLIVFFSINQSRYLTDETIPILIFSGFLAFYFLYLSKKQKDYYKLKVGKQ